MREKSSSVRLLLAPASPPVQTILEKQIKELDLPYQIDVAESLHELVEQCDRSNFDVLLLNCIHGKVESLQMINHWQPLPVILLVDGNPVENIQNALHHGACPCLINIADVKSLSLLPDFVNRLIDCFAYQQNLHKGSAPETPRKKKDAAKTKKCDESPQTSQEFLENVVNALSTSIAVLDDRGKILMVNQAWINYAKDTSLVGENLGIGQNYLHICRTINGLADEKRLELSEGVESVLAGRQESFSMEFPFPLSNQQGWFQMRILRFSSDSKNWILLSHENITELKQTGLKLRRMHDDLEEIVEQRTAILKAINWELRQEIAYSTAAEQALREEHNRFRTLVETIPHGIVEFDTNGKITFANAEYHRMHGYPEGILMGKCLWDVLKPIIPDVQNMIVTAFREQPAPTPHFNSFRDSHGKCVDHNVVWNYRRGTDGNVTGMVMIITDITQQRRAEEEARQRLNQLAHVTRMFTMNQMISGIAHELNQPLAAIANFAQACRYRISKSTIKGRNTLLESIEQISLQADRAGQIIRRLRDFVRRADSSRTRENINDLVAEVLGLLEIEARAHNVQVKTASRGDLPQVAVDRIQIEQVITNLVKNAMEATWDLPAEGRRVTLRTEINADGMLEVAVTDTGKGIEIEELNQVFEPFYTTKQSGMGLGLTISRSIVEAHGGRLDAVRNPSMGMTFRFTLPIAAEEEQA